MYIGNIWLTIKGFSMKYQHVLEYVKQILPAIHLTLIKFHRDFIVIEVIGL